MLSEVWDKRMSEFQVQWPRQQTNKFLCLHTLFCQVQEGQRCDDSAKTAEETNCKILAQVCVGFNYIT